MDEEPQFPAPLVHPLGWPSPGTSTTIYRGLLIGVFADGNGHPFDGEIALTWELKPLATWAPLDPEEMESRLVDEVIVPRGHPESMSSAPPLPLDQEDYSTEGRENLSAHVELGSRTDLDRVVFYLGTGLQSSRWDPVQPPGKANPVRARLTLPFRDWTITIDQDTDSASFERLRRQRGGYAFTHLCEIVRSDAGLFDSTEVLPIVQGIARAFTFTLGREIHSALVTGTVSGDLRWGYFGTPGFSEWSTPWSWSDTHLDAEQLRELIPLYLHRWLDSEHREVLNLLTGYYTVANRTSPLEPGLTTAISAILLLADHTDPARFAADISVAPQVRSLLTRCGLDLEPKVFYPELDHVGRVHFSAEREKLEKRNKDWRKSWMGKDPDSVASVVYVRNVTTHPKAGERALIPEVVWRQSWKIATEWLALGILHFVGYRGTYASRVTPGVRWHGDVRPVPWAPR